MALDGDVKVPVVGGVSKKAILIGGGGAAALMGFLWWRQRNAAPAAATDPALDPNAADLGPADMAGGGGSLTDVGAGSVSITPASNPVTTNAQWFAVVREALVDVTDPAALSRAVALYLGGHPIAHGSVEETYVEQARAAAGDPPVHGPAGYPPAIHYQPATGQTPPKTPPPSTPKSPTPSPKPSPSTAGHTYIVKSGDSLSSIGAAQRPRVSASKLYAKNKAVIEAAAHAHGHATSGSGHWIFPGTHLIIP